MNGKIRMAAAATALALLLAPVEAVAGVADCGMITNFASVTYQNTAGDPYTASYAVTYSVMVATPNISINKYANPTMQSAGGTVQFCINFQNLSYCASAVNVMIMDKVPDSMNFIVLSPNFYAWVNNPANNGTEVEEWSTNGTTWTAGEPTPSAGQYYLRWAFPFLAPRASGVICFRATVL